MKYDGEAIALSTAIGFDEEYQGRAALVATELATNLAKARAKPRGGRASFAFFGRSAAESKYSRWTAGRDRRPGPVPPGWLLHDRNRRSRARSHPPTLHSLMCPPCRTSERRSSRDRKPGGTGAAANGNSGSACLPMSGESVCGDGWASNRCRSIPRFSLWMDSATAFLRQRRLKKRSASSAKPNGTDPSEIMQSLHAALRPTRGGAAAVAVIDYATRVLRFTGIGNIAGTVAAMGRRQGLVSLSGTLGHSVRKFQVFEYTWPVSAR